MDSLTGVTSGRYAADGFADIARERGYNGFDTDLLTRHYTEGTDAGQYAAGFEYFRRMGMAGIPYELAVRTAPSNVLSDEAVSAAYATGRAVYDILHSPQTVGGHFRSYTLRC